MQALQIMLPLLLLVPGVALGQEQGWRVEAAASASLFFGASSQQLVASSFAVSRSDSTLSAAISVQTRYGEASSAEGVRIVSARAASGALSLDILPEARLTPFFFGTLESSLEKRIARRGSGGVGAKWVALRSPRGEGSLSLAVLSEATRPMGGALSSSLTRWSWRLKIKRKVQERLSFSHTTFYQPVIAQFERYLISSTTELAYGLTGAIALTLTLVDSYDSEARQRGARANNDGHFLAGLQARF